MFGGVQTNKPQPRRKKFIFGGVQTNKSQPRRKELIFREVHANKSQTKKERADLLRSGNMQSQSIRKEPTHINLVRKERMDP